MLHILLESVLEEGGPRIRKVLPLKDQQPIWKILMDSVSITCFNRILISSHDVILSLFQNVEADNPLLLASPLNQTLQYHQL